MDRLGSSGSAPVPHHGFRGPLPPALVVALLAALAAAALRGPVAGAQPPFAAPATQPPFAAPATQPPFAALATQPPFVASAAQPPSVAHGAAAPQAAAGTTTEPPGRVLNVTLVPPAAAPRADAGQRPGSEASTAQPARVEHPPAPPQPPSAGRQPPATPAAGGRGATSKRGSAGGAAPLWLALAAVAALLAGRLAWRRRPPRCGRCGASTRRLDAGAAFAELDMGERTEHLVGDVRYAVWRCDACGQVEKRGAARDIGGLIANATAPPVGSASFLRRRGQSGLSIWSPPAGGGAAAHRKPLVTFPRAPPPRVPAAEPPPAAPAGDAR